MSPVPEPDPRTDDELVAAVNRADPAAFEVLYGRYRDWVVRLAYRFTADRDDALDVLQETFAYVLRKTPGLRLSARMTTFLYPVVKNVSIGVRRKRRRHVSDEGALLAAPAPAGGQPDSSRADLAAVMAGLAEGQREVLLMRYVDGMSLAEIGDALGIPVGTVKSRIHNALATLRQDARTRAYFER